ncbi:MAG: hypothetical protein ABIG92_03055 [Candidatus Omnitrophota bacterium]
MRNKKPSKTNAKKSSKASGDTKPATQKPYHPIGVASAKGKITLFFKTTQLGKVGLYLTRGQTGLRFATSKIKTTILSPTGKEENIDKRGHISVSPCDKGYFMTFIERGLIRNNLVGAISEDLKSFKTIGKISKAQDQGVLVPNYKFDGLYVLYLGKGSISIATSKDLKKWKISDLSCLTPRSSFFDYAPLTVLAVSLTQHGILVVYDASYKKNSAQVLQVGGALFSLKNPEDMIWRSESPLWEETLEAGKEEITSIGAAFYNKKIFLYFASKTLKLKMVSIAQPFPPVPEKAIVSLKRFNKNPIIVPNSINEWETEGTFNPAALYDDGKVHLLYRAIGRGGMSCFGYASTKDGLHIDETLPEPAYIPREQFEGARTRPSQRVDLYRSGGGWGGCEDPKLTAIDDKIYLTYVAFSGYSEPRVALSSIKRADFLNKNWNWETPILISRPGEVNKSGCILPEKIQGKYVIFHRVFPHILIDYKDDLKFENNSWLETKKMIKTRPNMWDSRKVSVGATPIKTDEGWLVIYHAVDDRDDTKYKIGAMILDLEDPSKVLFRTNQPILEPEEHYENDWKPGIVYPCGAVVIEKELFVYYGGGDKFVCCATAQIDKFIEDIKKDRQVTYSFKEVVY